MDSIRVGMRVRISEVTWAVVCDVKPDGRIVVMWGDNNRRVFTREQANGFEVAMENDRMPEAERIRVEARYAALDRLDRRCDGNSGRCVHGAVERYTLRRADGNGLPVAGAETETRQSCSRHRQQFINSGSWTVVSTERLESAANSRAA